MKVTAIKQQVKRAERYSVFVDGKYEFSLSDTALLESKLATGQELTEKQVREFKQLSADDKVYNNVLRFLAIRSRSRWEIEFYLTRKKASPALTDKLLNKLSIVGLIDDEKFAQSYVNDRRLLRPSSHRKMVNELRKKHVAGDTINKVLAADPESEHAALRTIIERKRRQSKYQDNLKLMQYLARQGFNYGDIKEAFQDNLPG
jgi:regulatory protein